MPWLSKDLKAAFRESSYGFVYATMAIVFAVALDLLVRKSEEFHLSAWLPYWAEKLAQMVFITDFYCVATFCLKVVVRTTLHNLKASKA